MVVCKQRKLDKKSQFRLDIDICVKLFIDLNDRHLSVANIFNTGGLAFWI